MLLSSTANHRYHWLFELYLFYIKFIDVFKSTDSIEVNVVYRTANSTAGCASEATETYFQLNTFRSFRKVLSLLAAFYVVIGFAFEPHFL